MARGPNSEIARNRGRDRNSSRPFVFRRPGMNLGQRQSREVVAREKALAREVAVAVEVRLHDVLGVGEQIELGLGFAAKTLRLPLVVRRTRGVPDDPVLDLPLFERGSVQLAPPGTRLLECKRYMRQRLVDPPCREPVGTLELCGNEPVRQDTADATLARSRGAASSTSWRTESFSSRDGCSPLRSSTSLSDFPRLRPASASHVA